MPVMAVRNRVIRMAGRISENIVYAFFWVASGEVQRRDEDVDRLDPDEGDDDAADTVDQEISPQDRRRADGTELHAAERERDQGDDDQRVEDDRRQDRAPR